MNSSAGPLLREWRQRRRLSQLALAADAEVSQRHLSFIESGRSIPSRNMVLQLAERLEVPLRDRNSILLASGYAPIYPQNPLNAPEFSAARSVIERILEGHLPHPALLINRYWELLLANTAVNSLLEGVAPSLLDGTVNVLRLSLHPEGLAQRILNLPEWRSHVLVRLTHEIEKSADPKLADLKDEIESFPVPARTRPDDSDPLVEGRIATPLRMKLGNDTLSFLSTTTVFGTAIDVTLSEVTIETFFPADAQTASVMARLLGSS